MEDPGFVLIEAAINNIPIISNDSPNGPKEFIKTKLMEYHTETSIMMILKVN